MLGFMKGLYSSRIECHANLWRPIWIEAPQDVKELKVFMKYVRHITPSTLVFKLDILQLIIQPSAAPMKSYEKEWEIFMQVLM